MYVNGILTVDKFFLGKFNRVGERVKLYLRSDGCGIVVMQPDIILKESDFQLLIPEEEYDRLLKC
jgi:hypothetical protein